jgi:hypothetical protein
MVRKLKGCCVLDERSDRSCGQQIVFRLYLHPIFFHPQEDQMERPETSHSNQGISRNWISPPVMYMVHLFRNRSTNSQCIVGPSGSNSSDSKRCLYLADTHLEGNPAAHPDSRSTSTYLIDKGNLSIDMGHLAHHPPFKKLSQFLIFERNGYNSRGRPTRTPPEKVSQ